MMLRHLPRSRLWFTLLSVLAPALGLHAALVVTDLRCDWAVDPIGVDLASPALSWKLRSVECGARQTAWQVHVASTRDALGRGRPDLWDSGRTEGDRQLEVAYGGRPLRDGETVFWRVRCWDESGAASAWSPVATWTMGMLHAASWKAKWITDPELVRLTRSKLGFSTPPVADENAAQWLTLDLGRSYAVESVVLHGLVHTVSERLGFPRWFKVELADDPSFAAATVLIDRTKDPISGWLTRFAIPTPQKPAGRYLRITATKLRMMAEEDQPVRVGRLALGQLEVLAEGRNVAIGAQVTSSASLETGPWAASAVVDGMELPGANPRATETLLLRREFTVRPNLTRALLCCTGLGSYTAVVNGESVGGEELLKPAWTESARRTFYDTREITALLHPGANAIGLTLAGGMYNVPDVTSRYTKFVSAPRPLVAVAQLRLEYADGTSELVATDESWRVAAGPTTFAHMFAGEDYDARREPTGWDRPGFNAADWRSATAVSPVSERLEGASRASPPLRAQATLPVQSRREIRPGVTVFDLGQNASLMPRLQVHGPAGSTVKISPAELLNADGSIDPSSTRPAKSDASWNYTLRGSDTGERWMPTFFYHGARYLQVECRAPEGAALPVVDSIEGVVIHGAAEAVGDFSCSNELFNRIATLVRWAQRSNLVHVLTDCPHRERLGWLEQYHLNGPSLRANFDMTRLSVKTLGDMADAQRPSGLVPDVAPEYVRFDEGFRDSPEWGSAIILSAWQQYVWTGDTRSLAANYEAMQRYFAYLASRSTDGIVSHGLGDWYDLGPKPPGVAQLTPVPLTATAIYYEDARTMQAIANALDRTSDRARYAQAAASIASAFMSRFFVPDSGSFATGSQTANAMPLALGLVPDASRARVSQALAADVVQRGNAITAGDVGYRYLLRALTETGRSDLVFAINAQSEKPGYGLQLARGATSLAEAWDAGRRSSQNHFMLGQIVEWFYQDLAGLAPDPTAPGFGRVLVRPNPVGDVTWARARHESVRGPVTVSWRRQDGRFTLDVEIPANSGAVVQLPVPPGTAVLEGGVPVSRSAHVRAVAPVGSRATFVVDAGKYSFDCAF